VLRSLDVPGALYFFWTTVCGLGLLCFVLALSWQIDIGLGVTGLRTPQYWTLYSTNFVFWIGIGHVANGSLPHNHHQPQLAGYELGGSQ
jgi:Ni/Fe-hydrogenase subunit HybB-like protein